MLPADFRLSEDHVNIPSAEEIQDFTCLDIIHKLANPFAKQSVLKYYIPDQEKRADWILGMKDKGLVEDGLSQAGGWRLTTTGEVFLSERIHRRENTSEFKDVLRERLLRWAYDHPANHSLRLEEELDYFWFYGREVTTRDLLSAGDDLKSQGLVTFSFDLTASQGPTAPLLNVSITVAGREVAEDFEFDIRLYSKKKKKKKEVSRSMSKPSINIKNMNGGNVSLGDYNTLYSGVEQIDVPKSVALGELLRQSIPSLALSPDEQEEAEGHAAHLVHASDPVYVQSAISWIIDMATSTTSGALGNILSSMTEGIFSSIAGG